MGVVNVTPDSFTDGGKYLDVNSAVAHALKLVEQGAEIIDIGGQSTKPGAEIVTAEEELSRIVPVIKAFRQRDPNTPISVDTFNSRVAIEAINAGADVINDVTGGTRDPKMFEAAAKLRIPIVLMCSRPTPQYEALCSESPTKQVPPIVEIKKPPTPIPFDYDLLVETNAFFQRQAAKAAEAGVNRWQIIVDPGLGFAKTFEQSREILQRGSELTALGYPVLVGPSRKGFIADALGTIKNIPEEKGRMLGTLACCCASVTWGAHVARVHDVEEIFGAVKMMDSIERPKAKS